MTRMSLATKIIHKLALKAATTLADEVAFRAITAARKRKAQEDDAKAVFEAQQRRQSSKGE